MRTPEEFLTLLWNVSEKRPILALTLMEERDAEVRNTALMDVEKALIKRFDKDPETGAINFGYDQDLLDLVLA